MKIAKLFIGTLLLAGACFAAKTAAPPPADGTAAEIRIPSEIVPPGGTLQVKYSFTNPEPILTGGMGVGSFLTNGVSLSSASGDAAGVGLYSNGQLIITAVSPLGDLGSSVDYPFLTVTMKVPESLAAGTKLPLTIDWAQLAAAGGPMSVTVKPGTLTVGSNFWIHGVTPGGGTWPAGTRVVIDGKGFLPSAQLRTVFKVSSYRVVNPEQIELVLKEQTTMDSQQIQVLNGGFSQTYYSYLRGVPVRQPARSFLRSVEPVFQLQTHALATTAPLNAQTDTQYTALAIQNPNPGDRKSVV